MKVLITCILCLLLVNSYAAGPGGELAKQFGLSVLNKQHLKDKELRAQAAAIYTILAFAQELHIHQMGGATENKVFLHKDGHKEAVFNKEGKLLKDCFNQGSYNYYHPYKNPLGHFTADILPWLMWGTCPKDKSSKEQRIKAYMADVRAGFERAQAAKKGYFLPSGFDFNSFGQSEAISFYLKALNKAEYNFSSFVPVKINDRKQQELFFKALELGFKKLLISQ